MNHLKPPTPKSFFLKTAVLFGLLYVFLLPPGQVPDEPNHFYKAYHISLGHSQGETKDQRLGGSLPTSLGLFFAHFRRLRYHYDERLTLLDFRQAAKIPLQPERLTFQDFPNTAVYTPVGYTWATLTIWGARVFHLRPVYIFYLVRLSQLFLWIGMIVLAISWIPFGKWTLAILALLPSSLWIHCGVTADMVTNGVSFLLLALLLKIIYGTQPNRHLDFALALGLSAILASTKIVYSPIFAMAFLIPQHRFPLSSKPSLQKVLFISLGTAINLLIINHLYTSSKQRFIAYEDYNPAFRQGQQINEGANPKQQFDYVLHHPIAFAKTMITSYWGSAKATLAHYFGKFGWEKNYLPGWLIGLLGLSTLGIGFSERKPWGFQESIFLIGIAISMMIGFALIIYIQWSPVGGHRILNLAGRYMIPIFPIFYFVLPSLLGKYRHLFIRLAQVVVISSLLWGSVLIGLRYFAV